MVYVVVCRDGLLSVSSRYSRFGLVSILRLLYALRLVQVPLSNCSKPCAMQLIYSPMVLHNR